jgi:predicted dehydrogenase
MRKVRWGVFGTGAVAAEFVSGLAAAARDAPELHAVASRSADRAAAFARAFGAAQSYSSYDALARDPEVDVVYVATESTNHAEHAILALQHGKAVLCEKPFTVNAGEARRVIEVARRAKLFCMEGMWMRFLPIVRELKRLVGGGAIGELRLVTASLGFPYDRAHRNFDAAQGGGALLDLGVYGLSFAMHFLGRPTSVEAQAVLGATGVDEQVVVLLGFEGQRQAVVTTSLRERMTNDATLHGEGGMIRVHEPLYCPESATVVQTPWHSGARGEWRRRGRLAAFKDNAVLRAAYGRLSRARTERTIVRRRLGSGYAHEAIEVMRCLREGAQESPVMPLDESLAVVEAMDAVRARWKTGS